MPDYTILVTDIDGTLLDQQGHLPQANLEALRHCAGQGITIVLATGRNMTVTRPIAAAIAAAIKQELYLVLQDGCLLLRYPSMQVLQYHNLPQALAQAACNLFHAEGLPFLLFDALPHGESFTLYKSGLLSPGLNAYLQYKSGQFGCARLASPLLVAPSKVVTIDTQARIDNLYEKLIPLVSGARLLRTEAVRIDSAWFLEVGPLQGSKVRALTTLIQCLNCDWSEVIAMGDAENDIEMIQAAGLGVAMGNASERVKSVADLVIQSNVETGLAQFLLATFDATL